MGNLACHHVDFVGVGDRDQHVGVFCAGFIETVGVRCAAGDDADVQLVLQCTELGAVGVDNGDVILLVGQVLCEGAANLAGA